jgi:hypothetical protein
MFQALEGFIAILGIISVFGIISYPFNANKIHRPSKRVDTAIPSDAFSGPSGDASLALNQAASGLSVKEFKSYASEQKVAVIKGA